MTKIKNINHTMLQKLIDSDQLLCIDFYATWCGPCKMLEPSMESFQEKFEKITFVKVDVDRNEDFCDSVYAIKCMPTIVFQKGSEIQGRVEGFDLKGIQDELIKLSEMA